MDANLYVLLPAKMDVDTFVDFEMLALRHEMKSGLELSSKDAEIKRLRAVSSPKEKFGRAYMYTFPSPSKAFDFVAAAKANPKFAVDGQAPVARMIVPKVTF